MLNTNLEHRIDMTKRDSGDLASVGLYLIAD